MGIFSLSDDAPRGAANERSQQSKGEVRQHNGFGATHQCLSGEVYLQIQQLADIILRTGNRVIHD
jgi:hypothetical protein